MSPFTSTFFLRGTSTPVPSVVEPCSIPSCTTTVFTLPEGAHLKGAVALGIMVLVLLARPEGLFGVAFEEER